MTTKIQKWGNSLAMRLPKELANSFNLKPGSEVSFITNDNNFTIQPKIKAKIPQYTLEELVAGITPKNRHKMVWPDDKPRGKEVW
jgi:antitoxin MazE